MNGQFKRDVSKRGHTMKAKRLATRRKAVGVRLDTLVLAAAETAARDQHRILSNLIELAVIRFLQAEGYLPK